MIYYLRAIEQDWPQVEALVVSLGIAQRAESGLVGQGWVYIGPIYRDGAAVNDGSGNLFLHANLVADEIPDLLKPYQVPTPKNPVNVIFGQ